LSRGKRTAADLDPLLFWIGVFALAGGIVSLVLAGAQSLIGASTSSDRSSIAFVYLIVGVIGLAVAALLALAQYRVSLRARDPNARRVDEE
jgi:hypothetical protein